MKSKLLFLVAVVAVSLSSCKTDDVVNPPVNQAKVDSLVSGVGYATDVYYSLKNGVVKTAPRAEWDLAFATISKSVSILINSGSKDSLFVWKSGAIADFAKAAALDNNKNLATSFDSLSWYNHSAFEQNLSPTNPYDQGWGIYNGTTHDVAGDSVYILKLADGTYKKIAIISRNATTFAFKFKIANLAANAATDTVTITPASYPTKNFIYYAVATKTVIDREPDKTTWDFVFTKYDSKLAGNPLVSGILTNEGVSSVKLVGADSTKVYTATTFTKKVSNIGFDWKHFNGSSYDIVNPYYFVHGVDGNYYQLKFTAFKYATGVTLFTVKKLN
jgi:hypothetical protein